MVSFINNRYLKTAFQITYLKDSLRQDSRYFICPRSLDVASLFVPSNIPSSSAWQRAWISGWVASRYSVKVMLVAVVSWPSNMKVSTSCRQGWKKPGFKKKTGQWVFFCFCGFFMFFFGFLNIGPEGIVFWVFTVSRILFIYLPRRDSF